MSDRFPGQITIGGDIKRSLVDGLCKAICGEYGSLEWGDAPFEPKDEKELLEGLEDGYLTLKAEEARYGEFDELECFCNDNGIAYDRHSDGYCEYDPENVYFRAGMKSPESVMTDHQGNARVDGGELKRVIQCFETQKWTHEEMVDKLKILLPKEEGTLPKLRIVD